MGESSADHLSAVRGFIVAMRDLGALHVTVGDVSVDFAARLAASPPELLPVREVSDEERIAAAEALAYLHAEGF